MGDEGGHMTEQRYNRVGEAMMFNNIVTGLEATYPDGFALVVITPDGMALSSSMWDSATVGKDTRKMFKRIVKAVKSSCDASGHGTYVEEGPELTQSEGEGDDGAKDEA